MGTIADKLNKLLNTKSLIKSAIISKGQPVSDSDPFSAYPNKILAIQTGVDTSDATATASDIASGKTAYGSSGKITGAIPVFNSNSVYTDIDQRGISFPSGNNANVLGAINSDVLLRSGALVSIAKPKSGFGNATAADVLAGKRFTSQDGISIAGTLTVPEQTEWYFTSAYIVNNSDVDVNITCSSPSGGVGYTTKHPYCSSVEIGKNGSGTVSIVLDSISNIVFFSNGNSSKQYLRVVGPSGFFDSGFGMMGYLITKCMISQSAISSHPTSVTITITSE